MQSSTPIIPDSLHFQVSKPEVNFTGRSFELKKLKDFFSFTTQVIVAVCGMGGIGKTQLIRQFLAINGRKYRNYKFIWIDSDKEDNIGSTFRLLAKNFLRLSTINANGEEKDSKSVIQEVLNVMSKQKTFYIFDNVDSNETLDYILSIALPVGGKSHILITSRLRYWKEGINVIHLKEWNLKESMDYISKVLNEPSFYSARDKELLAETLQHLPLALRQATAYIEHQRKRGNFGISDYLREFETKKSMMLNSTIFRDKSTKPYKETTFTTWTITMDRIERDESNGRLAIKILNYVAYTDVYTILTECFLNLPCDGENQMECEERVHSAFDLLTKYCIIESYPHDFYCRQAFSIHRLVTQVIKLRLKESENDVSTLKEALDYFLKERTMFFIAESLYKYVVQTPHFVSEFSSHVETMPLLAGCYSRLRRHTDALSLYERLLEFQQDHLGESDSNTLRTKSEIATQYSKLNRHAEAIQLNWKIYATQRTSLDESHSDVLNTKCEIANQHSWLKQHDEAIRLYKEVYERQQTSSKNLADILKTKGNIAKQYTWLKQYDEALRCYQEVYKTQLSNLGETCIDSLKTKRKIAEQHLWMEKHDEALRIYQEIHETQKTTLGQNHFDTVDTKWSILYRHLHLKQRPEALRMYNEIYKIEKTFYGESHPFTSFTRRKMESLSREGGLLSCISNIFGRT